METSTEILELKSLQTNFLFLCFGKHILNKVDNFVDFKELIEKYSQLDVLTKIDESYEALMNSSKEGRDKYYEDLKISDLVFDVISTHQLRGQSKFTKDFIKIFKFFAEINQEEKRLIEYWNYLKNSTQTINKS